MSIVDDSETSTARTMTYEYDDLYRLTRATSTGTPEGDYDLHYGYDIVGNLTEHPVYGTITYGETEESTPHAATTVDGRSLKYDFAGNLVYDELHSYAYNVQNELSAVSTPSHSEYYRYNHQGQRVLKNDNANGQKTYYANGFVGSEETNTLEYNVSFGGQQIFTHTVDPLGDGHDGFRHNNHLQSTQVMTDGGGDIQTQIRYTPYGSVEFEEQVPGTPYNRLSFMGKERDGFSNLLYVEARYLDTDLGRFTTLDPWEGNLADPQSLNKYSYARNNSSR